MNEIFAKVFGDDFDSLSDEEIGRRLMRHQFTIISRALADSRRLAEIGSDFREAFHDPEKRALLMMAADVMPSGRIDDETH